MIGIDGQICYSPEPPEAYTRSGLGHGLWPKGDIAMWNMMWLSFPELDGYLNENLTLKHMMDSIDTRKVGMVMSITEPILEHKLIGLRDSLKKMPQHFLVFADTFPWERMYVYKDLGEEWVTMMRRRANLANSEVLKVNAVEKSFGNVIRGSFGGKK